MKKAKKVSQAVADVVADDEEWGVPRAPSVQNPDSAHSVQHAKSSAMESSDRITADDDWGVPVALDPDGVRECPFRCNGYPYDGRWVHTLACPWWSLPANRLRTPF